MLEQTRKTDLSDDNNDTTELTRSAAETEKKTASASVATALARYDLPVPGGPYSKIPADEVDGKRQTGAVGLVERSGDAECRISEGSFHWRAFLGGA